MIYWRKIVGMVVLSYKMNCLSFAALHDLNQYSFRLNFQNFLRTEKMKVRVNYFTENLRIFSGKFRRLISKDGRY